MPFRPTSERPVEDLVTPRSAHIHRDMDVIDARVRGLGVQRCPA